LSFGDDDTEIFMKGTNAVITNPDGGWQTFAEWESAAEGPGRFLVGMVRNFKTPAAQAGDLVSYNLKRVLNLVSFEKLMAALGVKVPQTD
jgi:hypothetical protein